MSTVRPLASFLTVVRFSKEARSCASASEINTKNMIRILSARCFIGPPLRLDQSQREEFDVTWGEGKLSTQLTSPGKSGIQASCATRTAINRGRKEPV